LLANLEQSGQLLFNAIQQRAKPTRNKNKPNQLKAADFTGLRIWLWIGITH